jgi:ribose 5-phosphate isomerase B
MKESAMKTISDKQILVAADLAGVPLKEAVVRHLKKKGWEVTDIGVKSEDEADPEMFHRIGLRVGAKIAEGEFERALVFCGTGMGIHIAASKCPRVHAAVVESVPAGLRSITGNNCNVLAMGAFYVAPQMGMDIADAYLEHNLGDGYDNWEGFYNFHKFAYNELENFDYQKFKENGFEFSEPVPESARLGTEPLVKKANCKKPD